MSARRGSVVLTGPNTHKTQGDTGAARSARQAECYELRVSGLTLRQIADRLGIATTTVTSDLRREIHERLDPLKDQYLQYELDRLDKYQQAVLTVLDNPGVIHHVAHWDGTYETNDQGERFKKITMLPVVIVDDKKILGAIDRLVRISESRRKLVGLDAPVKVQADVQVTETTQEDLELQELIREAKARAAAGMEKIRQTGGGASE